MAAVPPAPPKPSASAPEVPAPKAPATAPTATVKVGGVDVSPERLAADFPEAQRAIAEANRMLQEIRAARQTSAPPSSASSASAASPALKTLAAGDLSGDAVTRGLKEALGKGLESALARLGSDGGFLTNMAVRIPMPEQLTVADALLRKIGQGKLADDFVASMNHAAEQAVPAAAETFAGALRQMTVQDAQKLLQGPDDAATQFFRKATDATLRERFRPIVQQATAKTGVTAAYKLVADKAVVASPFAKQEALDVDGYVTGKALDGLFKTIAEEEKRIRQNPVARTTDLLKSVFGSLKR